MKVYFIIAKRETVFYLSSWIQANPGLFSLCKCSKFHQI